MLEKKQYGCKGYKSKHSSANISSCPVFSTEKSTALLSWFCNFAIGIPHHNIMDKREEELRIPEDLTVRYVIWMRVVFFTFACCQGEEGVCFQSMRLHQVGLSVSETLSLSLSLSLALSLFRLLSLLPTRLYYIVSSCIPTL